MLNWLRRLIRLICSRLIAAGIGIRWCNYVGVYIYDIGVDSVSDWRGLLLENLLICVRQSALLNLVPLAVLHNVREINLVLVFFIAEHV